MADGGILDLAHDPGAADGIAHGLKVRQGGFLAHAGNTRLIQSIVDSQNIIGNGYVARDYCAGYKMEFLAEDNPTTELPEWLLGLS